MPKPPRQFQVGGPPRDWKHWAPLLDGVPVGHCTAFDTEAGWVQVWTVDDKGEKQPTRAIFQPQRRLYGRVEAVPLSEWQAMVERRGQLEIGRDDEEGVPIPGTQLDHDRRRVGAR